MIKATVKFSGNVINKPLIREFIIEDEDQIAIQRKNAETNRVEQFTIRELFDSFHNNSSYSKTDNDINNKITNDLFPTWFLNKFIRGKAIEQRIIDVRYERI